jgi:hypothetical protein
VVVPAFFDAVGDFFSNLASIHWLALLIGLVAFIAYLTIRARAYFHVLRAEDIANGILYAVSQPPHVSVNEVLIRPTGQTN